MVELAIDNLGMWLYSPFESWCGIVSEGSRRELNFVSDNIKAPSGLAAIEQQRKVLDMFFCRL
jgi:hypothetical protein